MNNFDVIDDYESEAKEVYDGNKFINYSYDLHVCRMAGCNNFISDLIDEGTFSPHFCNVFTNAYLKKIDQMPNYVANLD